MLKFAGWDGIVIEGKADAPVWLDIRNDKVKIRNCSPLALWGTDTRECQEKIWKYVAGKQEYGDWIEASGKEERTTQRPAVLSCLTSMAGRRISSSC